jgi:hypothetical protein
VNGQVVIRPMMYLALSYDHRIVDGKEAVTFLVRVKESLEDPERLRPRLCCIPRSCMKPPRRISRGWASRSTG